MRHFLLLAVLSVVAFAGTAMAQDLSPLATSGVNENPVFRSPIEVDLVLDDGTAENNIGLTAGGEFVWFNRFTPAAGDYPIDILEVRVFFDTAGGCLVGDAMDIYVWEDADGNPANGATFLGSLTGETVQVLDDFSVYTFAEFPRSSTPGDLLVGVVNRGCITAGQFPAAIDQTSSQMRSWVGFGAEVAGDPPTLPTTTFDIIDNFGLAGNWLVRATYEDQAGVANELGSELPTAVTLGDSYPNPFNPSATVPFTVNENTDIRLAVYDAMGREVAVLAQGVYTPGAYTVSFDAAGLPSGTYLTRLDAAGQIQTRSVTLLK